MKSTESATAGSRFPVGKLARTVFFRRNSGTNDVLEETWKKKKEKKTRSSQRAEQNKTEGSLQSKVGFILLEVGCVNKGVDEHEGLDPAPSVLREQLRQKSAQGTTKEMHLWWWWQWW